MTILEEQTMSYLHSLHKLALKPIFFILIFSLCMCVAQAISVTPAKQEITFKPNLEHTFSFDVRNNAGYPVGANMGTLEGPLQQYATVSPRSINDIESWQTFNVTVKLPESLPTPGKNILKVSVVENVESGSGMVARTAVIPWIIINVPYPGRFLEIGEFTVAEGKGGINEKENTPVSFKLANRGTQNIAGAQVDITIQDEQKNILDEQTITNINIKGATDYTNSLTMNTKDLPAGKYKAQMTLSYDNETKQTAKDFLIGTLNISLKDYDKQILKKGIVPFRIVLQNMWKGVVDVEADITINQTTVRTARGKFTEFGQTTLTGYINTDTLELGEYDVHIKVYYTHKDQSNTNDYTIRIKLAEGISEQSTQEEKGISVLSPTIIMLTAMLLILLINLFIILRYKK